MSSQRRILQLLTSSPIIASVKDAEGLRLMLASPCQVALLLYGSINTLPEQLDLIRQAGKTALVDVDLIEGLSATRPAVHYLSQQLGADGVLSTRAQAVRAARQEGIFAILRFFMTDSMAFHNLPRQIDQANPDAVELLPGCMPKVIGWLRDAIPVPIIPGGLIHDLDDVAQALAAGCPGVATSNSELWAHRPVGK